MTENEFLNQIDDYSTSVHAIVGFANFYLWEPATKANIPGVVVFQGRHLSPLTSKDDGTGTTGAYVTPDLGVLLPNSSGVLAEVKISFPMDQSYWMADFRQLMAYDAELTGWPSADGRVGQHDVVLITEQGRAVRVRKFYEQHAGREIVFSRSFVIMSINRSDNRQPYYFFQRIMGTLTDRDLDARLEEGVKVPMKVFLEKYSTVKLYDAVPPLPYLMELIWTHVVVDVARQNRKFGKLRKRQKLPVVLDVAEIVERLREGFSFRSLDAHATDGSPSFPKKSWVTDALEQYVSMRQAEWIDAKKEEIRVSFERLDNPLGHFIAGCCRSQTEAHQTSNQQLRLPFGDE